MSATQAPIDHTHSNILRCTRCNAVLPLHATFCSQCGERVRSAGQTASSPAHADISERYRITSLVRRRPCTQLLFALDNQLQRSVAIHAIQIGGFANEERAHIIEELQNVYDLLRRQHIPSTMTPVELRYVQDNLYIVDTWPFSNNTQEQASLPTRHHQLSTLQALLQSGVGLPDPQVALTWIYRISRALEQLHKHEVILGDIDPDTILLDEPTYEGEPTLMVTWLPDLLHEQLARSSIHTNTEYFCAPETLLGDIEPRSDIYSLGAILYLLLTGTVPKDATERAQYPLDSVREINPRITTAIDTLVMRALSREKTERFQSASAFSEALLQVRSKPHSSRHLHKDPTLPNQPRSVPDSKGEMNISSSQVDNNLDTTTNSVSEPDDVTVSIVPLQAQMARRYLSRIKTSKLETQEKQRAEEYVEEGLTKKTGSTEDKVVGPQTKKNTGNTATEERSQRKRTDKSALSIKNIKDPLDIAKKNGTPTIVESTLAPINERVDVTPRPAILTGNEERLVTVLGEVDPLQQNAYDHLATIPATKLDKNGNGHSLKTDGKDTVSVLYSGAETVTPPTHTHNTEATEQEIVDDTSSAQQPAADNISDETAPYTDAPHKDPIKARLMDLFVDSVSTIPRLIQPRGTRSDASTPGQTAIEQMQSIVERVQRFVVGEPQHNATVAALIETPLRVQPNQSYSIRINVMGRDKPGNNNAAGLSGLVKGETVYIEVRSALYQNYAYIVQQAEIQLPSEGYVAEVTMPMQPLNSGPGGRRERLHIFFMDDNNSPLYEKPFVIELFISPLVQSGREGHNVLPIPL
jgi:serine/threonine protein kinase